MKDLFNTYTVSFHFQAIIYTPCPLTLPIIVHKDKSIPQAPAMCFTIGLKTSSRYMYFKPFREHSMIYKSVMPPNHHWIGHDKKCKQLVKLSPFALHTCLLQTWRQMLDTHLWGKLIASDVVANCCVLSVIAVDVPILEQEVQQVDTPWILLETSLPFVLWNSGVSFTALWKCIFV